MAGTIEARLKELGIELPEAPAPATEADEGEAQPALAFPLGRAAEPSHTTRGVLSSRYQEPELAEENRRYCRNEESQRWVLKSQNCDTDGGERPDQPKRRHPELPNERKQ